ncbi:hypothetical protein [Jeotgalibacillus aurantiacus]|uniref:hypothetical protein n=1 Tax=Jeotgalibacillus aurantiacus TaxID=2763266 RepID=UPI001D0B31C2|nr:hypothetical protein [Jeotgalibacillus aurantiacus]
MILLIGMINIVNYFDHMVGEQKAVSSQIEKSDKIMSDIKMIKLQEQIVKKLKQEGYTPTGTFGFSISSFEKKSITIDLLEIPKEKTAAEIEIHKIVNEIFQENELGLFEITIQ